MPLPPFGDPSRTTWFVEDQAIMAWLLKLEIPSICELMHIITPTKAIWDEWASIYRYESNISRIVEVYEQLFKVKQSRHRLQDNYANISGLLTQLKLYQPYTADLINQSCYQEELDFAIFLGGLDTSISSQIWGSILSESCLLTLATTFSSAL